MHVHVPFRLISEFRFAEAYFLRGVNSAGYIFGCPRAVCLHLRPLFSADIMLGDFQFIGLWSGNTKIDPIHFARQHFLPRHQTEPSMGRYRVRSALYGVAEKPNNSTGKATGRRIQGKSIKGPYRKDSDPKHTRLQSDRSLPTRDRTAAVVLLATLSVLDRALTPESFFKTHQVVLFASRGRMLWDGDLFRPA